MSPAVRLAFLSATAMVLFAGGAAILASVAYPPARARLLGLPPDLRARRVLAWAAVPWLAGSVLLALCFVPSLWSLLGVAVDHCPLHDDGHVHLCIAHAPHRPVSPLEWGLLLGGAAMIGAVAFRVIRGQLATWRAVAALVRLAGRGGARGGLVASSEPLSVTAGLLSPLVLVSTGLRNRLSPGQLRAVLAHEHAHARRRDPLRLLAVALLGAAHGPATRRRLAADLALACEEAADEAAAAEVGDRTLVAESILAVERLLGTHGRQVGLAMGMAGCAAEARVEALLRDPLPAKPVHPFRLALWGAAVAAALATAFEIHYLTETVLDLIAR
jgi:Zn-dependent protease with chaperone function